MDMQRSEKNNIRYFNLYSDARFFVRRFFYHPYRKSRICIMSGRRSVRNEIKESSGGKVLL